MIFPPETALRLSRKAMMEALGKMAEARAVAETGAEAETLKAIDRVARHAGDVILHIDFQLTLLERRQRA